MQSAKKAQTQLGVTQSVHGKSDSLISTQLTRLLQWPCAAGFSRRHIIERAGGNNHTLAVARCVGNRAIAVAADLPREAFRLRKVETFDQILPLGPAKLSDGHRDIRGAHSTCGFAATRAVAMPKPSERRAHLVAHRLT